MGVSGVNGIGGGSDGQTYEIPDYKKLSTRNFDNANGLINKDYAHGQRYTYVNLNIAGKDSFEGDISLRNIVTVADIKQKVEEVPDSHIEQKGGLYFAHGYDAHTPKDIVSANGLENVDLDNVAAILVNQPSFELKMTAHADRSGDIGKNQTLSENRLHTAEALMLVSLQKQGLTAEDAKKLFDERIAPHSTIEAMGELAGPVSTDDGVKHQGNRVVAFDLFSDTQGHKNVNTAMHKEADMDNHEHLVIVNMGTRAKLQEIDFFPEQHPRNLRKNQFSIADENTQFVFKIDPERVLNASHEFTVNYKAENNLVADNTNFVIENDTQGAVSSVYNTQTGNIDVRVNGDVAVHIKVPENIDPAVIRVGQVNSTGQVTISPLTNLADIQAISELRSVSGERNALTDTADKIVNLSIEVKHLYMESHGDAKAFQDALKEAGFTEKLDAAFKDLDKCGIDTQACKMLLTNQYANAGSALYNPDQVVFPFQVYDALYEGGVTAGSITPNDKAPAYDVLIDKINIKTAPATSSMDQSSQSVPESKLGIIKNN